MVLKQDQQRVRSLLTDAITILCRNGLSFKSEFSIEGLLGITLDNHDIFLINIKETIRNAGLSGCSPNSKDPLAPLDLMVFNSLGDVNSAIGEDLSMKNPSLTSTPGKKQSNPTICSYLDKLESNPDMGIKGDTSFNFALNYADLDMIEDLSRGGCAGKKMQNLTMDDLAVLDNDMSDLTDKVVVDTTVVDKVSSMKAEAMSEPCLQDIGIESMDQESTNVGDEVTVQEVLPLTTNNDATSEITSHENEEFMPLNLSEETMPLNLSEPKKRKISKKKFTCKGCSKSYKTEASLNKHKCKGTPAGSTSESTQPLDLTVGRLEEGGHLIVEDIHDSIAGLSPLMLTNNNTIPVSNKDNRLVKSRDTSIKSIKSEKVSETFDENNMRGEEEDLYVCICNKSFNNYDMYMDHTASCTKAKQTPYKACEICGKTFFSNCGYVKHKRLHIGAFKLRCKVCQKGFFDSTHLNAHMDAKHSKVRRYECGFCDRGFFWKHHLKRHSVTCGRARARQVEAIANQEQPLNGETNGHISPNHCADDYTNCETIKLACNSVKPSLGKEDIFIEWKASSLCADNQP